MLEIRLATQADRQTLFNLLEKYLYEFSQWDKTDVGSDGLYCYEWLDCYFTEPNRYPYLLQDDGKLVGFILVNDYPEVPGEKTDFCISEFFIMHKYRRCGYGRAAVFDVLNRHHGRWQLKYHPHNLPSGFFWRTVIDEYTGGHFRLIENYPNPEADYPDGTPAHVIFFEN